MRKLLLVIFTLSLTLQATSVFNPIYPLYSEIKYVELHQLSCGSWYSCSEPLYTGYLFLAPSIYPFNETALQRAVLYMDYLTLGSSSFTQFLPAATVNYYFNSLINVLWAVAFGYGYSQSYTVKLAETWIQYNFNSNGIAAMGSTVMAKYYGETTYDYITTLLALLIAFKSQQVDGILNGTLLNRTLTPSFWSSLLNVILNPPSKSFVYSIPPMRALLIVGSLLLGAHPKELCSGPVTEYYNSILNYMSQGVFVPFTYFYTPAWMGTAIYICHAKYGFFSDETQLLNVFQWLQQSVMNKLGGIYSLNQAVLDVYKLANGLSPLLYVIGDPAANSTEVALQDYNKFLQLLSGNTTATTIGDWLPNLTYVTITMTKLYSTTQASNSVLTVTAIPTPALLPLMIRSVIRRWKGQSSSRRHSPPGAA